MDNTVFIYFILELRLKIFRVISFSKDGHIPRYAAASTFTVGRSEENTIILNGDGISRKHLKVELRENKILITDLGTSFGTFYNKIKLTPNKAYIYSPFTEITLANNKNIILIELILETEDSGYQAKKLEIEAHKIYNEAQVSYEKTQKEAQAKYIEILEQAKKDASIVDELNLIRNKKNNFKLNKQAKERIRLAKEKAQQIVDETNQKGKTFYETKITRANQYYDEKMLKTENDIKHHVKKNQDACNQKTSEANQIYKKTISKSKEVDSILEKNQIIVKKTQENISELNKETTILKNDIENIKTSISSKNNKLTLLKEDIDSHNSDLRSIKNKISEKESELLNNTKKMEIELDGFEAEIELKKNKLKIQFDDENQKFDIILKKNNDLKDDLDELVILYENKSQKLLKIKEDEEIKLKEQNDLQVKIKSLHKYVEITDAQLAEKTSEIKGIKDEVAEFELTKELKVTELNQLKEETSQLAATVKEDALNEAIKIKENAKIEMSELLIDAKQDIIQKKIDSEEECKTAMIKVLEESEDLIESAKSDANEIKMTQDEIAKDLIARSEVAAKEIINKAIEKKKSIVNDAIAKQNVIENNISTDEQNSSANIAKKQHEIEILYTEAENKILLRDTEENEKLQKKISEESFEFEELKKSKISALKEEESVHNIKMHDKFKADKIDQAEYKLNEINILNAELSQMKQQYQTDKDKNAKRLSVIMTNYFNLKLRKIIDNDDRHDHLDIFIENLKPDLEKLLNDENPDELNDSKNILNYSEKGHEKVKQWWTKQSIKASFVVVPLFIYLIFPSFVKNVKSRFVASITTEESASDIFIKKEQAKKLNKPKFNPELDLEFGDTYTECVLYTKGFSKIALGNKYQSLWITSFNKYSLNQLELPDNTVITFISKEATLIKNLQEIRSHINPKFLKENEKRMTVLEDAFKKQMIKLLQTEENYNRLYEYQQEFYNKYIEKK